MAAWDALHHALGVRGYRPLLTAQPVRPQRQRSLTTGAEG
jgi:hypothetical protein